MIGFPVLKKLKGRRETSLVLLILLLLVLVSLRSPGFVSGKNIQRIVKIGRASCRERV